VHLVGELHSGKRGPDLAAGEFPGVFGRDRFYHEQADGRGRKRSERHLLFAGAQDFFPHDFMHI
jgi:hypothetical protein